MKMVYEMRFPYTMEHNIDDIFSSTLFIIGFGLFQKQSLRFLKSKGFTR